MSNNRSKFKLKKTEYSPDDIRENESVCYIADNKLLGSKINYESIFGRPDNKNKPEDTTDVWAFVTYKKTENIQPHLEQARLIHIHMNKEDADNELYIKFRSRQHAWNGNTDMLDLRRSILKLIKNHIK